MLIPASLITIVALIVLAVRFKKTTTDPTTKVTTTSTNWWNFTICLIVIVGSWLLVPLVGWMTGRSWNGQQLRVDNLVKLSKGRVTRADVVQQVLDTEQAQRNLTTQHRADQYAQAKAQRNANMVMDVLKNAPSLGKLFSFGK